MNRTQLLQFTKEINQKAIKVIDSCQNKNHIKAARKYINLLDNMLVREVENTLGVDYFSGSKKIKNNYLLTNTISKSFNKVQIFLKVKEQQIKSYEKD